MYGNCTEEWKLPFTFFCPKPDSTLPTLITPDTTPLILKHGWFDHRVHFMSKLTDGPSHSTNTKSYHYPTSFEGVISDDLINDMCRHKTHLNESLVVLEQCKQVENSPVPQTKAASWWQKDDWLDLMVEEFVCWHCRENETARLKAQTRTERFFKPNLRKITINKEQWSGRWGGVTRKIKGEVLSPLCVSQSGL